MEIKETPYIRPTPEEPAYFYHHFIKCGGSSVGRVLANWFSVKYDHFRTFDELEDYKKKRLDPRELCAGDCVIGHYAIKGTYLFERYPEILSRSDVLKAFTIIRDPLEFCLSFYYYSKDKSRMKQSLEEFFESNRNLLAYYFPCDDDNYREKIDRYFFVGTLERIEESLALLAKLTNRNFESVQKVNATPRDDQTEILSEDFVKKFMEKNELDYEIYNYVNEKLNDCQKKLYEE